MSDDNQQVSSQEQTPSASSQTGGNEPAEQTLEQVYQQFKVDDVANNFQPQRPQQQQQQQQQQVSAPAADAVPDPVLDPAGYRNWQAQQSGVFRQSLQAIHGKLTQLEMERLRAQEETDIRQAVSRVKEKVGGTLDDDFIEIALGQKARRDPKFLAIYNNRSRNPQAWNAALGAVASEFKSKFQYRTDSQLTENTRAAKQSTQVSLTAKEPDGSNPLEKRFEGKTGRDFDVEWDRLVHGGM